MIVSYHACNPWKFQSREQWENQELRQLLTNSFCVYSQKLHPWLDLSPWYIWFMCCSGFLLSVNSHDFFVSTVLYSRCTCLHVQFALNFWISYIFALFLSLSCQNAFRKLMLRKFHSLSQYFHLLYTGYWHLWNQAMLNQLL